MKYYGLNKRSIKYRVTSAFTALTILVQSMSWAMYGVVLDAAVSTPFNMAYAQEDSQLLNELRDKYKLDDPRNNYSGTEKLDELSSKEYEQSGRNLEGEIIQKYYVNPQSPSSTIDMSKYNDPNRSFTEDLSNNLNSIQQTQLLATPPSIGPSDDIQMNLPAKKNITFEKDENGKIVFQEDANGNIIAEEEAVAAFSITQEEIASSEYTHDQTSNDASNLENIDGKVVSKNYVDEDAYYEKGTDQIQALKTGTTSNALVYKSLMKANESNPAPQIHADSPLLTESNNNLRDARDGEGSWGAQCQEVTTENSTEKHYAVWESKRCASANRQNLDSCQVERDIVFPLQFKRLDGTLPVDSTIEFIDEVTLKITFQSSDNTLLDARGYNSEYNVDTFRHRDCRVYDKRIVMELNDGYEVVSAIKEGGRFDDVLREYVNGTKIYSHRDNTTDYLNGHAIAWSMIPSTEKLLDPSKYYGFPVDAYLEDKYDQYQGRNCEWGNADAPSVDITNAAQSRMDNLIEIGILLGVAGSGEYNSSFILKFNKPLIPDITYNQIPEGCADNVGWEIPVLNVVQPPLEESQFCTMDRWSCTESDSLGVDQTVLDLIPDMFNGDNNNVCLSMNAEGYKCDPLNEQQVCETLSDGTQHCFDWEDIQAQEDACEEYRTDELCYQVKKECQLGWMDENTGACYLWSYEYSCDIGPTVVTTGTDTTNVCAGAIPCMGTECDIGVKESNDEFAQAAAYSEMLNYMSTDSSCIDPEDPSTCTIFDGDKRFCSWDTTGLGNDCCEAPEGTSFYDYLIAANTMNQMALATNPAYDAWLTESTDAAWDTLAEPVSNAFDSYIYEPITSAAESIAGELSGKAVEKIGEAVAETAADQLAKDAAEAAVTDGAEQGIFAGLQQQAMAATNQFLTDTFGPDVASFFFKEALTDTATQTAGDIVMSETMTQVTNFLGNVMLAYMAYQMIKLLITLITACEEEEMDMGMLIMQRQCFPIGDQYCSLRKLGVCIMKRQDHCCYTSMLARIVMEQAYPLLGTDPSAKECAGLSLLEVENLDWDAINLDEWIAAMVGSGIMLDKDCMNDTCLNDRNQNKHDFAVTSDEKTEIYSSQEWAERASEIRTGMQPEEMDCSIVPQPIACKLENGG